MPLRWQSRQRSNDAVAGERSLAGQELPISIYSWLTASNWKQPIIKLPPDESATHSRHPRQKCLLKIGGN